MGQTQAEPLLETLVNDFGSNYAFALDLLEEYRRDRSGVDTGWRAYFDQALGRAPEPAPVTVIVSEAPQVEAAAAEAALLPTLARQTAAVTPGERSRAVAI